jgi:putative ABC transport system permease protein
VFRLAVKNVLARKGRLFLTAFAIIAGTAFLSGVLIFTGTIKQSFNDLFAKAYAKTDAYVRSANKIEAEFGQPQRDQIPDSLIAIVSNVPGVAEAVGNVSGFAAMTSETGKSALKAQGPPQFGGSFVASDISPWHLIAGGKAPSGSSEVVVDKRSAQNMGVRVGDTINVSASSGSAKYTIVGIATFGSSATSGGATWALFDLPVAQKVVLGKSGLIDAVVVRGDGSVSDTNLAQNISSALGAGSQTEVLTGKQITDESKSAVEKSLSVITIFLTVFAGISLFVGSFIIYNVFSISTAQRQRENALLRAIGASSRQVSASMFVEALTVGLVGSTIGFLGGIGLAWAITAILSAVGFGVSGAGLIVAPYVPVIAIVIGSLVTLLCAIAPALRAGRIPPLAAMRDVAIEKKAVSRGRIWAGVILVAIAVVSLLIGLTTATYIWLVPGVVGVYVAFIILGPMIAGPTAALVGRPLRRFRGVTGKLAGRNAARSPRRTALTAGALMIGVSLIIGVATIGSSVRASVGDIFAKQFKGDYAITPKTSTNGFGGLSPTLADQVAALPEVETASGLGFNRITIADPKTGKGVARNVIVVDPKSAGNLYDLGFTEGSLEALSATGIAISVDRAKADNLALGSTVGVTLLNQAKVTLTVQGIFKEDTLANRVVSRELFKSQNSPLFDFQIVVTKKPSVSDATARAAIAKVIDASKTAKVQTKNQYIHEQSSQIDSFLNFIYALLGMSIFIAAIGIVITLLLAVYERRRELGLMRAVGSTRWQIRESILWESWITSILGATEGVIIGVLLGWVVVRALRKQGLSSFSISPTAVVAVAILSIVLGLLAAWLPSRRAAKADILAAIATT